MNKLGFYVETLNAVDRPKFDRALREVRPPVMLFHLDANRDVLINLRKDPDARTFVVGRLFKTVNEQNDLFKRMLEGGPEVAAALGRSFAEEIIGHDPMRPIISHRENGRLLVDAWMSLNESIPGPFSEDFLNSEDARKEIEAKCRLYDVFQVAFRNRLKEQDPELEAVAFNFGAGNFQVASHFLEWFPQTLSSYVYLGFHEYGWPALSKDLNPEAASSAGDYRTILEGIRNDPKYGHRHKVIITEAGLARMFKHKEDPPGDVGWLYEEDTISEEDYWASLEWYNGMMAEDDYVMGACLYQVGHQGGKWRTFRHIGQDNEGHDIGIMDRIKDLAAAELEGAPRAAVRAAAAAPVAALRGQVMSTGGEPINGATVRLIGGEDTMGGDPQAVANNRGAVTWTRAVEGYAGNAWNAWQRFVARDTAGITWHEFRAEVAQYNPSLQETDGELWADRIYYLPENRTYADTRSMAPAIVWDRALTGFEGDRWTCWRQYVQGKVVGLSWDAFGKAVVAYNPRLSADDNHFRAAQDYLLPRNAGQEEYARVTYTLSAGRFAFEDLQPGTYRLEVSAPGYQRLEHSIVVSGEETVVLTMEPGRGLQVPGLEDDLVLERALAEDFVRVKDRHFVLNGHTFRFIGVNLRALAHYGTPTMPNAPASQQRDQLRAAREMGARVVRIFLPDRNVSVDTIVGRLKGLVSLMNQEFADMYLIVALTNLYHDVPFHVPGDDGFYDGNILRPDWFQNGGSENYRTFVEKVVAEFKDEPRIMAYNIGNELKAQEAPGLLVEFMHKVAELMRQLDGGRHLVTTGMISTRHGFMQGQQALRERLYESDLLHFITNHAYHDDDDPNTSVEQDNDKPSREDDSDLAVALNKPLLIEEAGLMGTGDRTHWVRKELDLLLDQRGAAGYMPWGFMKGGDNGDGDKALGMDTVWHGADWDNLFNLYRERADRLASEATPLTVTTPASEGFTVNQQIFTATAVNLRVSPGRDADKIRLVPARTPLVVLGGPQQASGLTWWNVQAGPDSGWMAQVESSGLILLTAT